jgi:hypothetical protein
MMDQQDEVRALHAHQALPFTFECKEVEQKYTDGMYASRLDAELEDILRSCFPEQKDIRGKEDEVTAFPVEATEVLRLLNCIALIQNGTVVRLLDVAQMPTTPLTAVQKSQLYLSVVKELMAVVTVILDDHAERHAHHQSQQCDLPDDGEEGAPCCG